MRQKTWEWIGVGVCALIITSCFTALYITGSRPFRLASPLATLVPSPYPATTTILTQTSTLALDVRVFLTADDHPTVTRWYTATLTDAGWTAAPTLPTDEAESEVINSVRLAWTRQIGCSFYTFILRVEDTPPRVTQILRGGPSPQRRCP